MTTGHKLVKNGFRLASTQVAVQISNFLRNLIVARLISPANFGIAATFALTWALLEMSSYLAAEKLLIQAEDGDQPKFQESIQLVQAIRGLINGAAIFLCAGPIARLFGAPDAKWAFQLLALAPVMWGLTHGDLNRMQREMKFRPTIMVDVLSSVIMTLLAIPLGFWLRDYSVMLWVLLSRAFVALLVSHLVAERPYRWTFDGTYVRRALYFGWPLLVNGLLLYVILHGDHFVIASGPRLFTRSIFTLSDLGIYSAAFSLTMASTSLISNVGTSLFLPLLAQVQNSSADFERRYVACARVLCLSAAILSVPVIVGGHWLILMTYGPKYAGAESFIGWLAAMWALRAIRQVPTLAAMAKSDTQNAMVSNVVRTVALVGVLSCAAFGLPLKWVAASGFVGELLATVVSIKRLEWRHGVQAKLCFGPAAVSVASMAIAACIAITGFCQVNWLTAIVVSGVLMLAILFATFRLFPELRRDLSALPVFA